jgi:hypothetical protein
MSNLLPMPDGFVGNGLGTAKTGKLVHWLLRLTPWRKYIARLDAEAAPPHDWAWQQGGDYTDFLLSNDALYWSVWNITGSDFLADRTYNAVSYIGYGAFNWSSDAERDKARVAADQFWAKRGQDAAQAMREIFRVLSVLGVVTVSQTKLDVWVQSILAVASGIPWAIAVVWGRKMRHRMLATEPPK